MTQPGDIRADAHAHQSDEDFSEGLPPGFGAGISGKIAFGTAIAFALFTLWPPAYGALPSQVVRAMHVDEQITDTFQDL